MYASAKTNPPRQQSFPKSLKVVAYLMIVFGFVEMIISFARNFFAATPSPVTPTFILSSLIGVFSCIAGLCVLTKKKNSAILAIGFLGLFVIGRIIMIVSGFSPIVSDFQSFAVILEISIAVLFGVHLVQNIQYFE